MHTALNALTEELKRLRRAGTSVVSVSSESLDGLRQALTQRQHLASAPAPALQPEVMVARVAREVRPALPVSLPSVVVPAVAAVSPAAPTLPPAARVLLPEGDKRTRWDWLLNQVVENPVCRANVRPGKKAVLGVGSLDAKIMFVGEAPGAEEEIQGEPFVGPAGKLLTRMIQAMGLSREEVYIGNIMNWRPGLPTPEGAEQIGNRPPTAEEMAYGLPNLVAQIEIVQPEILVALGSTAAQGLLGVGSFKTLGEIRGRWKQFAGKPVMVTYHPSYILRNNSNRSKRAIWEDLLQVMERAVLPISDKQRAYFLDK